MYDLFWDSYSLMMSPTGRRRFLVFFNSSLVSIWAGGFGFRNSEKLITILNQFFSHRRINIVIKREIATSYLEIMKKLLKGVSYILQEILLFLLYYKGKERP